MYLYMLQRIEKTGNMKFLKSLCVQMNETARLRDFFNVYFFPRRSYDQDFDPTITQEDKKESEETAFCVIKECRGKLQQQPVHLVTLKVSQCPSSAAHGFSLPLAYGGV